MTMYKIHRIIMMSGALFLLMTSVALSERVIFPENSLLASKGVSLRQPNLSIIEVQGQNVWESHVDNVISDGITTLTLAIDKELAIEQSRQNMNQQSVVFSPVSIAAALALVLLGSNGKTFEEVSKVMGLASGVDISQNSQIVHEEYGRLIQKLTASDLPTKIASAIFVQENYVLRQAYKEISTNVYKSEVVNLDFARNPVNAQMYINNWVSERTNGKIKDIIAMPPPTETALMIVNALYFNGAWEQPFVTELTRRQPFYTDGVNQPSKVMVDMMANGGEFPYFNDSLLDCEILGLPYKGNSTTMYIIIPKHSNQEKLRDLEDKLTAEHIDRLVQSATIKEVIITVPKMRLTSTLNLESTLKHLGIQSLFNPAEANLVLISPGIRQTNVNMRPLPLNIQGAKEEQLIFSNRMGENSIPVQNCTSLLETNASVVNCTDYDSNNTKVVYKKFGNKIGRRIAGTKSVPEVSQRLGDIHDYNNAQNSIDGLRHMINSNPKAYPNPGLYASQIRHKVVIDITEVGTEGAAATALGISRSYTPTIRANVPFLFFIRHHETKLILFWSSVKVPTPNF